MPTAGVIVTVIMQSNVVEIFKCVLLDLGFDEDYDEISVSAMQTTWEDML